MRTSVVMPRFNVSQRQAHIGGQEDVLVNISIVAPVDGGCMRRVLYTVLFSTMCVCSTHRTVSRISDVVACDHIQGTLWVQPRGS